MRRPRPRVGCAGVRGEEKDFRGGGYHEKRLTVGRMLVIGVGIWGGLGTYFPRKVQNVICILIMSALLQTLKRTDMFSKLEGSVKLLPET